MNFSSLESRLDDAWHNEPQKRAKAQNALEGLKSSLRELESVGISFGDLVPLAKIPLTDHQMGIHEEQHRALAASRVAAAPEPEPEPSASDDDPDA